MKIAMLCFSENGQRTGERLREGLCRAGNEVTLEWKSKYLENSICESHTEWAGRQFDSENGGADAVIFIGACGIAVRSIAPFVKSKKTDPAVLVADECGKFVISLLSGHLGGANELAALSADILEALPVITTATDLHRRFAVDVFAKKNNCAIFPMNAAKAVSAALLAGEAVGFYSDFPWDGELPDGIILCRRDGSPVQFADEERGSREAPRPQDACCTGSSEIRQPQDNLQPRIGIAVSIHSDCSPFSVTVHVVPRIVSLGIGCRKNREAEAVFHAAESCLLENSVFREALFCMASIDLKKSEAGLLALSQKWKLPFLTYDARSLRDVQGSFSTSAFVETTTGVDNVCERSAVLSGGCAALLQTKKSGCGVTTALAVRDWRIRFE